MATYVAKVKRDIERWVGQGVISPETAQSLSSDIEKYHRGFSFVAVLSIMASAFLCAALLLLVAANWEEIPRIARVAVLFSLILAGYVGGAVLKLREREILAEALWVLAATAFGASIALIAQMYHMSGDEAQAILAWCIGTALAAAILRSAWLTAGAAILAVIWMQMVSFDSWQFDTFPSAYFLLAVALYILSMWTQSAASRRILLLSLCLCAFLFYARDENLNSAFLLCAFFAVLYILAWKFPEATRHYIGVETEVPVLSLIGILAGIGIMQFAYADEDGFLFVSIAAFIVIIALLMLSGRENVLLRWLAYAAFIFQLCLVYLVTIGSMLDTATLFLVGGLSLSALAWGISRLEHRFTMRNDLMGNVGGGQ